MIKDLIGYQLITLDEKGFTVRKGDETKHFVFEAYEADPAYEYAPEDYKENNVLKTELLISDSDTKNNPIITNVEYDRSRNDNFGDKLKITFFGINRKIVEINNSTYTTSGWWYGSTQSVICVETSEEEILTEW